MYAIVYLIVFVGVFSAAFSKDIVRRPEEQGNLFEGDIELTTKQRAIIDELVGLDNRDDQRKATSDLTRRWTDAVVPYIISAELDTALVEAAMDHWKSRTCITFTPRTDQNDYVSFVKGKGCKSFVGKIGGSQSITLGDECDMGSAVHEIGHAIGFWHEQSRPDRDDFVVVHSENIKPGHDFNFEKKALSDVVTHNIAYDIGSIMHYSQTAFSVDGQQPTISAKNPADEWKFRQGQGSCLSGSDSQLANIIYECSVADTCTDEISNCPALAAAGECLTNVNYMKTNCKRSCYLCDGCCTEDTDPFCPRAAAQGRCINEPQVLSACPLSCKCTAIEDICVDLYSNCAEFSARCDDSTIKAGCKMTCKVCTP